MANDYDELSTKQKIKVNTAVKPRAGDFRLIDLDDLPEGDVNKKYLIVTHNGKYLVTKVLGQGVFGQVFKGIDLGNKQQGELAIKLSNMIDSIDSPIKTRNHALEMERETLTKQGDLIDVGSRNINDKENPYDQHLTIMTMGPEQTLEDSLYQYQKTTEVNEQGLAQETAIRKQIDPLDALLIGAQLLDLMRKLQELGVIHTDLKPDNLLWDPKTKRLVVVDFGENIHVNLIKEYENENRTKTRIGQNGEEVKRILIDGKTIELNQYSIPDNTQNMVIQLALPKGNSQYAAPEANGFKQYSVKSDNYSIGIILAELFTDFNLPEEKRAALNEHGFETKAEDMTKEKLLQEASSQVYTNDMDIMRIDIFRDVIAPLTRDKAMERGNLLDASVHLKQKAINYLESKTSSELLMTAKEHQQYLTYMKFSLLQSQISKLQQENPALLEKYPTIRDQLDKLNDLIHTDPSKTYSLSEIDNIKSILQQLNIQYITKNDSNLTNSLKPLTEPISSMMTDQYLQIRELESYINDPSLASAKSDLNMISEWLWVIYENDPKMNKDEKSKIVLANYILKTQNHIQDKSHPIHQKLEEIKQNFNLPAPDQQTYDNLHIEEESRQKRKKGFLTIRGKKKKDTIPQPENEEEPSTELSYGTQSSAEMSVQTESYSSDDIYDDQEIDLENMDFTGQRTWVKPQIDEKRRQELQEQARQAKADRMQNK